MIDTHSQVNGLPFPVYSEDVEAAGGVKPIPDFEDYVMARRCGKCGAEPGVNCTISQNKRWHAQRIDKAIRHRAHDQEHAPLPEQMLLGVTYGTLDKAK